MPLLMQPNLLRNLCFLPTKNTKYRTFYRTHFLLISITCLSRYISLSFYRPALGCSLHCICFSVFVVLLPNVFHTNDMFALSEKSAEKKTKTGRLPIAHYKQKPSGSDLWPVNRCIPTINRSNCKRLFFVFMKHSLC